MATRIILPYKISAVAVTAFHLVFFIYAHAANANQGEPTNAAEAAAKKATANEALDKAYQEWKATLSPEHQAWESVLEERLGDFYLPIHKREKVNATPNAWDYVVDNPSLPRVLLIGDSISRGYTMTVRATLADIANVHRAPENCGPTANGLEHLDLWLGKGKWDIIHFNFGIHDRKTPVALYEERLETIIKRLEKTGAKLIWATTTPVPADEAKQRTPESIVERNVIATGLAEKYGLVINDLFTFITPHLATVQKPNDVHFKEAGNSMLGEEVAKIIKANLK